MVIIKKNNQFHCWFKTFCWWCTLYCLQLSCKELTHWKRLWCWGLGAGGEGDDRGWDGWMASLTRWTWVWVNSGSWWWTGRPGALRFMGSQRVGHDWATELNWTCRTDKFRVPERIDSVLKPSDYIVTRLSEYRTGRLDGYLMRQNLSGWGGIPSSYERNNIAALGNAKAQKIWVTHQSVSWWKKRVPGERGELWAKKEAMPSSSTFLAMTLGESLPLSVK